MRATRNPALSRVDRALSEFSKARWADEPIGDGYGYRGPRDLDLVARPSRRASFGLVRFLIAFCGGIAATLAWQSHGGAARRMIANWSSQLRLSAPQAAPQAVARAIEATGFVVQLSAQRSEPDAQAAFRTMQAKYPVLSGRQPLIRRKDQGERGIYYVTQVGPFGEKNDADKLCETLKSTGGSCFVHKN